MSEIEIVTADAVYAFASEAAADAWALGADLDPDEVRAPDTAEQALASAD